MNTVSTTSTEPATGLRSSHRHGSWAWLLIVPPAFALLGGMITLYFVLRYPDHEVAVEHVTEVSDDSMHQHVVNSVTPPLK